MLPGMFLAGGLRFRIEPFGEFPTGNLTSDKDTGLGNWSAPYSGAPLAPGVYTFTAAATDLAGNAGPASAPYVVDTSLAAPSPLQFAGAAVTLYRSRLSRAGAQYEPLARAELAG